MMRTAVKSTTPVLDKAVQGFAKKVNADYELGIPTDGATFAQLLQNRFFLVHAIRKGIPYTLFEMIAAQSPFGTDDWIKFLDISLKTLQRHKAEGRDFKPSQSEKILEVAEVIQLGKEVFGDLDNLGRWLETPVFALGNQKPIDLLQDSYGKELVMNELMRIEYGIFA